MGLIGIYYPTENKKIKWLMERVLNDAVPNVRKMWFDLLKTHIVVHTVLARREYREHWFNENVDIVAVPKRGIARKLYCLGYNCRLLERAVRINYDRLVINEVEDNTEGFDSYLLFIDKYELRSWEDRGYTVFVVIEWNDWEGGKTCSFYRLFS